jgi:hypothetical protein
LLTRKLLSNTFYRFLIDSNGIVHGPYTQQIGSVFIDSTINHYQACVSTNGEIVAYNYGNYQGVYHGKADIFNFDRCTGLLYNPRKIERTGNQDTVFFIGVSFSPNNKFLYLNGGGKLYQIDLDSTDLLKSSILVGKWDSTFSPFATTFYYHQLAPDGKIYVSCQGGNEYIHCITNPDTKGVGCNFIQKYKWFGTNTWFNGGTPNQPNYNLGVLAVICNTGENEIKPANKTDMVLFPNPVTNQLTVISNGYTVNAIEVMDMLGRKMNVTISGINTANCLLNTENLSSGIYQLKIVGVDGSIINRKFVKQ